ncbi:protein kinase [Stieleria sp. JC731]|uniref:serine/threonine-protein kinase n=1 Tax=Stieleria sp. JC731 TaxID=2894195 RepID=UPI001E3D1776|nr:serine/threonine-protein kinase [Stieleria sp. JC731]MCC9599526.1 protein kinase [Stieleria sp. JC731]
MDQSRSPASPTKVDDLTDEQQEQLTSLLDRYLLALESGQPPQIESLLEGHEELEQVFRIYLAKLDVLYGIAVDGTADPTSDPDASWKLLATNRNQVGDYKIIRTIGRGGMGMVCEAIQVSMQRRVAIKLLPFVQSLDQNQVARFENEARSVGLLDHPNIVGIIDVGIDEGLHFFAMQFIDGQSLHQCLQNGQLPSDWKVITRWMIDAANALHHAHENRVIHRDIKPHNLLVDRSDKIWVADFGLAQSACEQSLTSTGDMLGTVRYMSPEQAAGNSAIVDGRCDIYSLAATFYELLTHRPVFDGESTTEILRQIDAHQITPLHRLLTDLPRDLSSVIEKALSKSRDDRYETAAEFAADLGRILRNEPTIARPPSPLDRAGRFLLRNRRTAAMLLACCFIAVFALCISTVTFASLKQRAEIQAAKATHKEHLARNAVDRLGFATAEMLANIPAAQSVRRQLLNETLAYYQELASDARQDGSLHQELAMTLTKIGILHRDLGYLNDSLEALHQSDLKYQELLAKDSDDVHQQTLLLNASICRSELGETYDVAQRPEESSRWLTRAIVSQKQLLLTYPSSEIRNALASSYSRLGSLLAEHSAIGQAQQHFENALHTLQDTDEANPLRSSVEQKLCSLLAKTDPRLAIRYGQSAFKHQSDQLESNPDDTIVATEIAITLDKLGLAYLNANDERSARQSFKRGIDTTEQILALIPNDPRSTQALLSLWNHQALLSLRLKMNSEAIAQLQKSYRYASQLKKQFPDDAETTSTLASIQSNLGQAFAVTGEIRDARDSFNRAIKQQLRAIRLAPSTVVYQNRLKQHQTNLDRLDHGTISITEQGNWL